MSSLESRFHIKKYDNVESKLFDRYRESVLK